MAFLKRDQVKVIVADSLKVIADLPADVEEAPLNMLNEQQQQVFLSTLKTKLNASPYYKDDGSTSDKAHYDVDLNARSVGEWADVKACIDWVKKNHKVIYH